MTGTSGVLNLIAYDVAGTTVGTYNNLASGTGRISATVTVAATTAAVVVRITRTNTTPIIDDVRLSLSGATDWVAPDPGVAWTDAASLAIPPLTPDLPTAQTGWLAVRLQPILPATARLRHIDERPAGAAEPVAAVRHDVDDRPDAGRVH